MRHISFVAVAIAVLLGSGNALAGRGASYSSVESAIRAGGSDAIIAELERAEDLICPACIGPVEGLLASPDYRVREVAAWWFARRPAEKARLATQAMGRLSGTNGQSIEYAADLLGTFRHPDAIEALSAVIPRTTLPPAARMAAVRALGTIGHPAAETVIVQAMGDAAAPVRVAALESYWRLRGTRGGSPLAGLLSDSNLAVRRQAAAVAGSHTDPSLRTLLEARLSGDADAIVRRNAAYALGRLGDAASRSILRAAADGDASSIVRSVARASLRSLR